jgi:hypothetical protein
VTEDARRWTARIGRAGYAARAAVYCLIAAIALDAVRRFDPAEPRGIVGALHKLADRTGGRLLLGLLAIGLLAQVVWRGMQVATDIERPHGHAPRWTTRFGWGCIGVFYATLFVRAVGFLFRQHGDGGGHKRSLVKRVLAHSSGRALIFGIGAGLLVFAVVELVKAWRATFLDDFDRRTLGPARRRALTVVGRVGLVGRGFVFGAGGVLLLRSAWRARADTIGTGDVLRHLVAGPFGQPLVGAIALGLFAYAALMICEAAWRRNVRV